jgi:diadenylate cyclase
MLRALLDYRPLLEIFLFSLLFYGILSTLQGTRAGGVLKGLLASSVLLFVVLMFMTSWLELPRLQTMLNFLLSTLWFIAIVVFAPDIRRLLARMAPRSFHFSVSKQTFLEVVHAVANATEQMSRNRIGGLIVAEREIGLKDFIETGVKVDADVTSELLSSIFYPGGPLHDGAVIIQGDRIVAARCILPLTENPSFLSMGTRHQAAVGVTDETDALSVVVSEETGILSLSFQGRLIRGLDREGLIKGILEIMTRHEGAVGKLTRRWRTGAAEESTGVQPSSVPPPGSGETRE